MIPKSTGKKVKVSYPISFRVGDDYYGPLTEGSIRTGLSVHAYARLRLTEVLDSQEQERLLDEVAQLREEVSGLRNDMTAIIKILLLNLTEESEDQINEWIDTQLGAAEGD